MIDLDLKITREDLTNYKGYPFGYCFLTNKVYIIKEIVEEPNEVHKKKMKDITDNWLSNLEVSCMHFNNTRLFQDPMDSNLIKVFAHTQMVLCKYRKGLIGTAKTYAIVNADRYGLMLPNCNPLDKEIINIWNITPEEYFVNTSPIYRDLHPELQNLYHPEYSF